MVHNQKEGNGNLHMGFALSENIWLISGIFHHLNPNLATHG
jgi:hypothetical protein